MSILWFDIYDSIGMLLLLGGGGGGGGGEER